MFYASLQFSYLFLLATAGGSTQAEPSRTPTGCRVPWEETPPTSPYAEGDDKATKVPPKGERNVQDHGYHDR
jgi:hypothetical protein